MSSFQSNRRQVEQQVRTRMRNGLVNMAGDVVRLSTRVTPYRDGDLRMRRRVEPKENGARILWLSDHAAVQNRGVRKGRPFRHYTTPGTGPQFVEAGIKAVKEHLGSYFR